MGVSVWGSGFWGLGFRVGFGFYIRLGFALGFRLPGLRVRPSICDSRFRLHCLGFLGAQKAKQMPGL